jgi:hypothetical protein
MNANSSYYSLSNPRIHFFFISFCFIKGESNFPFFVYEKTKY